MHYLAFNIIFIGGADSLLAGGRVPGGRRAPLGSSRGARDLLPPFVYAPVGTHYNYRKLPDIE